MDCERHRATANPGLGQSTVPVGDDVRSLIFPRPHRAEPAKARGWRRAVVSGVIGLAALVALASVGGRAGKLLHVPLPGPVIGLALLAVLCLLAQRFHTRAHQQLTLRLLPVSRLLVAHLGLLFVPAGVGIITEGEAIRKEWLPLLAGLAGSTLLGLVATGWFMHRFAPKSPAPRT